MVAAAFKTISWGLNRVCKSVMSASGDGGKEGGGGLLWVLLQDRSNKEAFKRAEFLSSLPQFGFKRPVNCASAAGMPVSESTTDGTTRLTEDFGPNRRSKTRSSVMRRVMRGRKRGEQLQMFQKKQEWML